MGKDGRNLEVLEKWNGELTEKKSKLVDEIWNSWRSRRNFREFLRNLGFMKLESVH